MAEEIFVGRRPAANPRLRFTQFCPANKPKVLRSTRLVFFTVVSNLSVMGLSHESQGPGITLGLSAIIAGPMSFEIERKFLVRGDDWRALVSSHTTIRQAYLASSGKSSIRVRICGDATATLTIKSRPADLRRLELEYPIPVLQAEALMALREGSVIEKTRYVVPRGPIAWEIDIFSGENEGLIIAEVELKDVNQPVDLPSWIGREVTALPQYYNSFLVSRPFRSWSPDDQTTATEQFA